MKNFLVATLALFLTANFVQAQKVDVLLNDKAGWHKIGQAKVNFKSEKDEFLIMGADKFKSIRVKIKDAPIQIQDMQIFYDGGSKEDVSLKTNYAANTESRVIDLKNHEADLKKVVFVYHTVSNSNLEKAEVELWGLN